MLRLFRIPAFPTENFPCHPRTGSPPAGMVALLALGAMPAVAQDAPTPPPEIAEKAALCASCHGANGLPVVEKAPILFGQHSFYLLTQLRDFRAGRRASDLMATDSQGALGR